MTGAFTSRPVIGRRATVVHRADRPVALPRLEGSAAATPPAHDGVLAVVAVFALDLRDNSGAADGGVLRRARPSAPSPRCPHRGTFTRGHVIHVAGNLLDSDRDGSVLALDPGSTPLPVEQLALLPK